MRTPEIRLLFATQKLTQSVKSGFEYCLRPHKKLAKVSLSDDLRESGTRYIVSLG